MSLKTKGNTAILFGWGKNHHQGHLDRTSKIIITRLKGSGETCTMLFGGSKQRQENGAYVTRTDITYDYDSRDAVDWCGNILWLIFGGFLISFQWLLFGLLFSITIIGIPCGLVCFKMSMLTLLPFGKDIVHRNPFTMEDDGNCLLFCGNLIWLPFGILFAVEHFLLGVIFFATILCIPLSFQHFKLGKVALWPFGYSLSSIHEERVSIITSSTP
ncbi:Inner membrane protein YccF [Trichoplax sp. H2]|nr:Inner membrane protein YccF [Trichoplax sp. H2]|eukprot:RDD41843.1 Inner membrane protein YccF [Trichoplax sp. H2]